MDELTELHAYDGGATATKTSVKVVVSLSFNDLPRVMNGRPEDPIQKRSFARAFSKAKIVSAVKKLGLYPINPEQACSHPKVRDDTKRADKVSDLERLQAELSANLAELAKQGVKTKALAVQTKKREQPIEEANIAAPMEYEQAYRKLVADGVTSTNIWITLGAVAFNSAEVLAAELERVRILEHGRKQTAYNNQQKFLTLQTEAKEAFAKLPKPKKGVLNFDGLKAAEVQVLMRYVFKADGRDGISKQKTTREACIEYLSALEKDELKGLIDAPHLLEDAPLLEAPVSSELTSDEQQPFHVTFGKVTAEGLKGLVPLAPPEWLDESLSSPDDKRLDGKMILVNWGDESEPDWFVGKLSAKGDWELEGTHGNFKASYGGGAGDTAVHLLTAEGYATSVEGEPECAWVLLGKPPPAAAASSAAPPLALPAPTLAAKTPTRRALMLMGPPAAAAEEPAVAAAPASTRGAGKKKAAAEPTAGSSGAGSSGAGSSGAGPSGVGSSGVGRGAKGRASEAATEAAPAPPALDLRALSAAQLADMQCQIALLLQSPAK
eukprot:4602480-Prymnesium_polylepis.1